MQNLDDATIDELFGVLSKYVRLRERAAQMTLRTEDGALETAAYKCLFHLAGAPMRTSRLAEIMVTDPSTVSRHVASLVELGYIRREADPDDGRATLLVATEAGMARAEEVRAHRRSRLYTLLDGWTGAELETLVALLTRFVDAAEEFVSIEKGSAT
ncbi:putative MarR family transcriptional regulator [Gordonia effusa NBRC 100432]|uniref:Putative MarR family transcriptional regulator n=1 Tax=Gordonia effusa NBRC 100432 TaxID=1077974 RepID=H0R293_9ACTN|nr:MarR family transcriptional regulator [Gordonia effusa]GAB19194.1 putative MarR family transcriptional regulator [Gordonia effusa NBRC 100432]